MRDTIVCLADVTGIMAAPWVRAGYRAVLVDPQHPEGITCDGPWTKIGHPVDHPVTWAALRSLIGRAAFAASFPVCTELAVSGTAHWKAKREREPNFQAKAMQLVHECRVVSEMLGCPYLFENPISAISSIYRKPDHIFSPHEFGGYLADDDEHPVYPDFYPPRDAYGKKTCLWVGNGFRMPQRKPVPIEPSQLHGQGASKAHNKLGGTSDRTKNIRSATPRGFAEAVFSENGDL